MSERTCGLFSIGHDHFCSDGREKTVLGVFNAAGRSDIGFAEQRAGVEGQVDRFGFWLTGIRKSRSALDGSHGVDLVGKAVMDELGVAVELRCGRVPPDDIEAFRMGAREQVEGLVVFEVFKVHLEELLFALLADHIGQAQCGRHVGLVAVSRAQKGAKDAVLALEASEMVVCNDTQQSAIPSQNFPRPCFEIASETEAEMYMDTHQECWQERQGARRHAGRKQERPSFRNRCTRVLAGYRREQGQAKEGKLQRSKDANGSSWICRRLCFFFLQRNESRRGCCPKSRRQLGIHTHTDHVATESLLCFCSTALPLSLFLQ